MPYFPLASCSCLPSHVHNLCCSNTIFFQDCMVNLNNFSDPLHSEVFGECPQLWPLQQPQEGWAAARGRGELAPAALLGRGSVPAPLQRQCQTLSHPQPLLWPLTPVNSYSFTAALASLRLSLFPSVENVKMLKKQKSESLKQESDILT